MFLNNFLQNLLHGTMVRVKCCMLLVEDIVWSANNSRSNTSPMPMKCVALWPALRSESCVWAQVCQI